MLVSTYSGHRWNIRMRTIGSNADTANEVTPPLISWIVTEEQSHQHFIVTREDIDKALLRLATETKKSSAYKDTNANDAGNGISSKQSKKTKRRSRLKELM